MTVDSKKKAITTSRIEELEAENTALKKKQKGKEENTDIRIAPDEYISVMSLIPYHLNLSTREFGTGKTYKFERFGQIKRILYSDLVDIFETHPNFLEAGYFYILSPKVLRHHGLEDSYEKILTKEKIEEILIGENKNVDGCIALYESANKFQQEVIVSFMTDKLIENPAALDLNFVDRITRISGVNIAERANDARESFSPSEEE